MSVARQDTEMPYSMEKPSTKKRHDDGPREDHRPTAKSHIFFFSLLFLFLAFIWSYQTVCIYFVVTSPRLTSVRHFFSVPLSEYWILKSTSYCHRYFHSCWNVNCYSNKTTTQKKKERKSKGKRRKRQIDKVCLWRDDLSFRVSYILGLARLTLSLAYDHRLNGEWLAGKGSCCAADGFYPFWLTSFWCRQEASYILSLIYIERQVTANII